MEVGREGEEERVWGLEEMSAPTSFYSSPTSLQRQGQAVTAMVVCVTEFVCLCVCVKRMH